jgi:hypothetical protein
MLRPLPPSWRLTSCMPCSFGLLPHPRSGSRSPAQRSSRVTVIDRCIPLGPLLMARGWHGRRERRGSHLKVTVPSSRRGRDPSSVTAASLARARRGLGADWAQGPQPLQTRLAGWPKAHRGGYRITRSAASHKAEQEVLASAFHEAVGMAVGVLGRPGSTLGDASAPAGWHLGTTIGVGGCLGCGDGAGSARPGAALIGPGRAAVASGMGMLNSAAGGRAAGRRRWRVRLPMASYVAAAG